jgi:hypothetical protein
MTQYPSLLRNLVLLASMLVTTAWRFLLLCLRPSPALATECLLLCKQLALCQERQIKLRRTMHATRKALTWLARCSNWQHTLAMVLPAMVRRYNSGRRWLWRTARRSHKDVHVRCPQGSRMNRPAWQRCTTWQHNAW